MDLVTLSLENIDTEHICCALDGTKNSNTGVAAKKEWLQQRIKEGLVFKKLNARGKVFIEYLPVEKAWLPIIAKNYMYINCHWVSGSFKGKGYGTELLKQCEDDARKQGMDGVVLVASTKKKPYLSDKSYYLQHGYGICDKADPYFELLVRRFNEDAELPQFNISAKEGIPGDIKGLDIFYTAQCPFTISYVELLKPVILASDIPVRLHRITSREEAQSHFCPVTTYSVFVNGKFYMHEILSAKKLEQILATLS